MLSSLLLLGLGCDIVEVVDAVGATPSNVVSDVRVLAAVLSQPEIGLGDAFDVYPTIGNPEGRPLDVMAWICLPEEGRCVTPPGHSMLLEPIAGAMLGWNSGRPLEIHAAVDIDPTFLALVEEVQVPVFVLACEAGQCPIVELIAQGGLIASYEDLLSDPDRLLGTLPEEGVDLAVRTVVISANPVDPNTNPSLLWNSEPTNNGCPVPLQASGGEIVPICLQSRDPQGGPLLAHSYSSAGLVRDTESRVQGRTVNFTFQAPQVSETTVVDLWFVAEEDDGAGSGVFRTAIPVLP